MKSSRATTQKPVIPPRRRSVLTTGKVSKKANFTFPDSHQLVITTPASVFIWGNHGIQPVFQSATNGIVAAKKTAHGGDLLAVADSQVVLLHDLKKGNERKYKLKGSDGHVRLIRYAPDTDSLFFTTTLQNAVRAYSLQDEKLLASYCDHPSPPTVIALSTGSHWLLSASAAPPMILLNNLLLHTPAVMIRPQCSSAAVVAADFHPQRTNIFLLAFADGACAMYDAARRIPVGNKGDHQADPVSPGAVWEISHVKGLHAIASSVPPSITEMGFSGPGFEYMNHIVGDTGIGITAVAFVPGSRTKAVTVGADGKCCVIDLLTGGKNKASVLRSWHIQGSATSLALLSSSSKITSDDSEQSYGTGFKQLRRRVLVAIGRQDGKVLLFNLGGYLLRDREFSLDGSRIIELEWTLNRAGLKTGQPDPRRDIPSIVPFPQKRGVAGVLPSVGVPMAQIIPVIDGANDELKVPLLDSLPLIELPQESTRQGYRPAVNHLDCFKLASQNTSHGTDQHGPKDLATDKPQSGRLKNSTPLRGKVFPELQPSGDGPSSRTHPEPPPVLPPIPPRPKRGKARGPLVSQGEKRHPITSAPNMDPRPEEQRGLDDSSAPSVLPRSSRAKRLDVIALNHAAAKHGDGISKSAMNKDQSGLPKALVDNNDHDDGWMDIAASSRRPARKLNGKPARIERRKDRKNSSAFQQPTPSIFSEASNDIVIDWTPASAQLVVPPGSLLPNGLPEIPPRTTKRRKKPVREPSMSNDTIVQWSSFREGHIFAMPKKDKVVGKSQRPSSSVSPNNNLSATPTKHKSLAEIRHNPKQSQQQQPQQQQPVFNPPPSPSRPPPPPPLPLSHPTLEVLNVTEPGDDDRGLLQAKISFLRDEIARRFQAQKTWFDAQLQDLNEGGTMIEEENRWLRKELEKAKSRKGSARIN